jgi:hypothetical protein
MQVALGLGRQPQLLAGFLDLVDKQNAPHNLLAVL